MSMHFGQPRKKGFAESDPSLDVEGVDAQYKLSIILLHAFGKRIEPTDILCKGISSLHPFDFKFAREKNQVIKLIASAKTDYGGRLVNISVLPTFISKNATLAQTSDEFNGVLLGSSLADEQLFYGKGAGRYPTSSAVLSDISAFKYGYKYEYKKGMQEMNFSSQTTGRFYVGFNKDQTIDQRIFTKIEEQFSKDERHYVVAKMRCADLKASDLLKNKSISVIAID